MDCLRGTAAQAVRTLGMLRRAGRARVGGIDSVDFKLSLFRIN
jgi:hypothetical protein